MIGIIDYKAGNIRSVKKAFDYLGYDNRIISNAEDVASADAIVLPGVGAFGSAVENLHNSSMFDVLKEWINSGKKFLGICLGMHLLLDGSDESPGISGFGLIKGNVIQFRSGKIPQIGWNRVEITDNNEKERLFSGVRSGSFFYFLHGYYVPEAIEERIGISNYHVNYCSALKYENVYAVQFHPEKSGNNGLKVLDNWVKIC